MQKELVTSQVRLRPNKMILSLKPITIVTLCINDHNRGARGPTRDEIQFSKLLSTCMLLHILTWRLKYINAHTHTHNFCMCMKKHIRKHECFCLGEWYISIIVYLLSPIYCQKKKGLEQHKQVGEQESRRKFESIVP